MTKRVYRERAWLLPLLVTVLAVPASGQIHGFGLSETVKPSDVEAAEAAPLDMDEQALQEYVQEKLQDLDLRERLAQLMLVTITGARKPGMDDRQFLERYTPGGVVVPTVLKPDNAAETVVDLREQTESNGVPLFIATNVHTLPSDYVENQEFFVPLPSPLAMAATGDPDVPDKVAECAARHLDLMGFNMHLGPNLELAETLSPADGSLHRLGEDPEFAAACADAYVKHMSGKRLLTVPMGFPGGGANRTARTPAVLVTGASVIRDRDLLPFIRAIEAGAPVINVGNTLAPTLGVPDAPACLSGKIVTGLLRGELGFDGIVVAGPIDSRDIAIKHTVGQAAVMALQAGADMLYWRQSGQVVMKTVDDLVYAVKTGLLPQDLVDQAFVRVLQTKLEWGLHEKPKPKPRKCRKLSKDSELSEMAYDIERRSITLVQNRDDTLPLTVTDSMPVGITGVVAVEPLHAALEEYLKHVSRQRITTARHGNRIYDFEVDRITRHAKGLKTVVVVLTPGLHPGGVLELIRGLHERGPRVVVVLTGFPYSLPQLKEADAVLLAYCEPSDTADSMRAVADVLVGKSAVSVEPAIADIQTATGVQEVYSVLDVVRAPAGRLPVDIEAPFENGWGIPYDPTYAIKEALWEFGDGAKEEGLVVKKAFETAGRYPVTLTVTDKKGATTSRTFHAVVR